MAGSGSRFHRSQFPPGLLCCARGPMDGCYQQRLSGERLRRCYEVASPRIRRCLEAELEFVLERITGAGCVLELGCGYGRVLERLAQKARFVVGIDSAQESLALARSCIADRSHIGLVEMNAGTLGFADWCFGAVVCIQNGISAFEVDRRKLVADAVRVVRPGGVALFSSWSPRAWKHRLEWFRDQVRCGLLVPIDEEATGDGTIACRDGFRAETVGPDEFRALASGLDVDVEITEVDASSLFCVLRVR